MFEPPRIRSDGSDRAFTFPRVKQRRCSVDIEFQVSSGPVPRVFCPHERLFVHLLISVIQHQWGDHNVP